MVSNDCNSSVEVCALRVAQLTSAGAPKAGLYGYYSNSPISIKAGPTNDTQAEKIAKNGCGTTITRIPPITTIKGATFSVDLSRWDRALIWLLTGGTLFSNSSARAGIRSPYVADGEALPCCIEWWAKAYDGTAQAVTSTSTPNGSYHHYVEPMVRCAITEWTNDENIAVFTVTGEGTENPSITANGPWNDWPSWIAGTGGFTASWGEYDDGTIPTAACGLQTVPSGS